MVSLLRFALATDGRHIAFAAEALVSRPRREPLKMSTIDLASSPSDLRALAEQSNAWPFEQAKAIVARLKKSPKDEVLFETGYGPSGLPHIGTFGEVARTTMVRHAFRVLTEDKIKTRLLAFSDDMDGLRKVPDNVPNKEMLAAHLGKPLTRDARSVLERVSVVRRAQQCAAARVPRSLRLRLRVRQSRPTTTRPAASTRRCCAMLERYDEVMDDHAAVACARSARATYSPFLPICPRTGMVLQVPIDRARRQGRHRSPTTIRTREERVTLPVTGGHCKLQWKPDWAMRWFALGVDYEMAGKDLIDSVKLSGKICARARRHAAGRLQLRALPRREGPEDFQVEGQRPHHRRVAALCLAGIAVAVHVPRAEGGEAAVLRRDPAQRRRLSAVPRRLSAAGCASSGSPIRSGTSIPASRRRPTCRSRSSCC